MKTKVRFSRSKIHNLKLAIAILSVFAVVICIPATGLAQETATAEPTQTAKPKEQEKQSAMDWTQWRGPNRDGILKNTKLPESLDEKTLVQKWKIDLGPSYSGPIVAGDHVYVTETENKTNEVVICLNRNSGEEVWRQNWRGAMKMPFFAAANGDWIRATPAYSDGRLYINGILENFVCLDAKDGSVVWQKDFPTEIGTKRPPFGGVCSPMIDGDHLYLQTANCFLKLDKKTGKEAWRSLNSGGNMMSDGCFSSPIIATVAGKRQAIVQTRTNLCGVDLESGAQLWSQSITAMRGMNILTPTVHKDGVFTSAYRGTSQFWNLAQTDGKFSISEAWQTGSQAYMGSPVIVDGHAYIQLGNRLFACFDLNTGKEVWRGTERFGKYANLVTDGKQILALDESGWLLMFPASPTEHEIKSRRKVGTDNWAHLGVRGNQIFVRGLKDMQMFEWEASK